MSCHILGVLGLKIFIAQDSVLKHNSRLSFYCHYLAGGCSRSVWTVLYQFWTHLIWAPKLGNRGKKFFVKVNRYFV